MFKVILVKQKTLKLFPNVVCVMTNLNGYHNTKANNQKIRIIILTE